MSFYKPRGLPHWNPGDAAIFVTWRVHGSLPAPQPEWEVLPRTQRFFAADQASDRYPSGPQWLKSPAVAEAAANALHYGAEQLRLYELDGWVIMSNHVHILIHPRAPLERITKAIKTYSAREANRILDRTGPFWQSESYDHWVRGRREFDDILQYIELNPVNAGLVASPEEWRWSSAWQRVGQEAYPTEAHT